MISSKGKPNPKRPGSKSKEPPSASPSSASVAPSSSSLHVKPHNVRPKEVPSVSKVREPEEECSTSTSVCFPQLKTIDHVRILPRFTAILNRTTEEGVGMEDLDTVQLELETLLSSVAVRIRVLQNEIVTLDDTDEKKIKLGHLVQSTTEKRIKNKDDKPVKRVKDMSSKSKDGVMPPPPPKVSKLKNTPLPKPHDSDAEPVPGGVTPRITVVKNRAPTRFWAIVHPYCIDIMEPDLQLLENLITSMAPSPEMYKVPPLGRHYSLKWAQEDLQDQMFIDIKSNPASVLKPADCSNLLKRAERGSNGEVAPGSLTQQLVAALVEEKKKGGKDWTEIFGIKSENIEKNVKDGENICPKKVNYVKNLNIRRASELEKCIQKELELQGILEPEDAETTEQSDDEILIELKRCQDQLKVISTHNIEQLKNLCKKAKQELTKQTIRRKLKQAEDETLEAYRRIVGAHQKKRVITKKEKEGALKALRDQELLVQQLETTTAT